MVIKNKYSLYIRFSCKVLVLVSGVFLTAACSSVAHQQKPSTAQEKTLPFPKYEQLTKSEQLLADSILTHALDHEALYSLLGDLKPMSSIGFSLSYPVGKDSLNFDGQHDVVTIHDEEVRASLSELHRLNRVLDALSFENYTFLLVPFKRVWKEKRHMQILLCRTDLLDKLLTNNAPFFSQWGFVSGSNPAVVLTAAEFESRNDRYRAYGYLFGYPRHAVDFFVDASIESQKTDKFVKRSFFNIPVFTKERGYFTYALPENFTPITEDSLIYNKAIDILENYKSIRPNYLKENGKLDAVKLFRDWWRKSKPN